MNFVKTILINIKSWQLSFSGLTVKVLKFIPNDKTNNCGAKPLMQVSSLSF